MPQAGAVGGHENGTVLDADDGREEPGYLIEAENDGETFGLLGAADAYHDPCAVEGDLVEESQGSDGLIEDAP
jgi:hypothetical protein